MKFKHSVRIEGLSPIMLRALAHVDEIHHALADREAIVTSINDSRHGPGSLHYTRRAFDLRTRDLNQTQIKELSAAMDAKLESMGYGKWDVVVESDHIHVEWDPA